MELFKQDEYPSMFAYVSLTLKDIEDSIVRYHLVFLKEKNPYVEWGEQFPMFADSFYRFVYINQKIPNQSEFWNQYITDNKAALKSFRDTIIYGLKARAYRSYPSFVRDIHFGTRIKNNLPVDNVIYNRRLDVSMGIDLMIINSGRYYAINLFINTKRAKLGRQKKEHRHNRFTNVEYLDLEAKFDSLQIGDFYLYGDNEYNKLSELLKL